ncbi:glycosyltransferase family 10 domain-containing protein [Nioella nitratireducens]|uniref:glycosyltransferase family 10 domain-containing protein n=1 Tax=Nioella nitratireducens TaxID=1287720 RepID=UPI0008FD22F7|nr:glycosyltransferase family 10 [Nioella nitratireducens]
MTRLASRHRPGRAGAVRISVFVYGGYRNRQPLAYAPIRERLGDRIALVDTAEDAQLLVVSHYKDFELFGDRILALLDRLPHLHVLLLSEEPFWDSIWMPDPLARSQRYDTGRGHIQYTVLSHQTSAIFHARHIPYFLLTDSRYIAHYRPLFSRNAGMSAEDWHRQFAHARHDAVFLNIRRTGRLLHPCYPSAGLWALSVYRSEFAALCRGTRVVREGQGWVSAPPRQELTDWHADKLCRFDLSCRYMSAFENTHQPDYVSEKIYDALAVGAVPLYMAAKRHGVFRLLGSEGWLNFSDRLDSVPAFDAGRPVDLATCAAYARLQDRMARLFDDRRAIEDEYERLCTTLMGELTGIAHGPD